jgi:nucleotide-binding universal stress UspA family protein
MLLALKESAEVDRLTAAVAAISAPGASVHVVHVLEGGATEPSADARAAVEGATERLGAMGLDAQGRIEPEGPAGVVGRLAELARRLGVELVVVGSRGLGPVTALLGHSVSHELLAGLDVPVLVVPAGAEVPTGGFGRAVLALRDVHEVERAAAALALLPPGLQVQVVHRPMAAAIHRRPEGGRTFLEAPETSDIVLRTARRRLRELGMRVSARDLPPGGDVATGIVRLAHEWEADVVVLGSRRLHDWEALLVGSTSHEAIRLTDLAVLVIGRQSRPGDRVGGLRPRRSDVSSAPDAQ